MLKILAIDDMQINLFAYKELLADAFPGVQVITAMSGEEGIKKALSEIPDVILIDLVMPDMDGIETCKRLKKNDSMLLIPVIMLSASSPDSKTRAKALQAGVISFLTKPIDTIELTAQISSMVQFKNDEKKLFLEQKRVRDSEKQRADGLEKELKRAYQALEQSPVSIIITDIEGNILYCNPKVIMLSGYSPEELYGQNSRIFSSGETKKEVYQNMWETILSGKEWRGEFHNKMKDGTLYWESVLISPLFDSEGNIINFLAVKEDLTEWKKMVKEMEVTKMQAQESDRLKSAFLMNVTHEIRTPMNAILGFSDLLKTTGEGDKDHQEFAEIIENSGHRLLNSLNELIEIAKIEAGQTEISNSVINLNEQIDSIYSFFKSEIKGKGLKFIFETHLPDKKAMILTDAKKLSFVLVHLINNAVRYSERGKIEVGYVEKGGYLEFFVKDNGPGISEEKRKIIFEKFRKSNDSALNTHQGMGLGLTISKAFVEMLKGRIWVESEKGKGAKFYFTIPYHVEWKEEMIDKK